MKIRITNTNLQGVVNLPASKSEGNRALIIEALLGEKGLISNIPEAEDTQSLVKILHQFSVGNSNFDVGPAGTTMRFLTAFSPFKKERKC
ncbi:MAG: hypothetical protein JKY42_01930 [Flavobacteriales bacterium]|nr:hypothetical protein [Flavobacteriales bacterium]